MKKDQQHELDELKNFVQMFLDNVPPDERWAEDIIDQAFLAIEAHVVADTRYHRLVFENQKLRETVNQQIGRFVKEYTDLEVIGEEKSPRSKLIQSYSRLGNG